MPSARAIGRTIIMSLNKHGLNTSGFSRSQIDDPSNLVSIPRLKHYQITGWYSAKSDAFGGLSPREYLSDKRWEERRRVGLDALVKFGILKP
jgi:hypothetical protein